MQETRLSIKALDEQSHKRHKKMITFLKLYFAIAGYIGSLSNNFMFDHCSFSIKKGRKKWLILLSLIFISIPGLLIIVCNSIDRCFDLSLSAILLIYIFLYLGTATIAGFMVKHFTFKHIFDSK